MPYRINNFDGSLEKIVEDYKVDRETTTTPIVGQYVQDYAPVMAESLLWIMENFSSSSENIYLDGNPANPLIVEAENSPPNPINGQLWWDYGLRDLKVFKTGTGWTSLTDGLAAIAQQHFDNQTGNINAITTNPHNIQASDIGLGNVNNVPAYDSELDFAEYQNGDTTPGLNISNAQFNLNVYSKGEQYNKTEILDNFLTNTGEAVDAQLLNGLTNSDYVKVAGPFTTAGVDATAVSNTLLVSGVNGKARMELTPDIYTSSISYNYDVNAGAVVDPSEPSASLVFDNETTSPALIFALSDGFGLFTKVVEFTDTGITEDGDAVYHQGNPPTAADIGALEVGGTAVDSTQLNNYVPSVTLATNTIVKRSPNSVIIGSNITASGEAPVTLTNNSQVIFKQDWSSNSQDETNQLRAVSKTELLAWTDINNFVDDIGSKGWVRFNSGLTYVYAYNCAVVKLGTGLFRVTLTGGFPGGNYTVVTRPVDDQQFSNTPSSYGPGGNAGSEMDILSILTRGESWNTFLMQSKRYQSFRLLSYVDDAPWDNVWTRFRSQYRDSPEYSLAIFY